MRPSVFVTFAVATVFCGSSAQLPTTVTRNELVPVGYKPYNPYPQLSADWFLCRRGDKIVACSRNYRPSPSSRPTGRPQALLASSSSPPTKRCMPGKTCIHGSCLGTKCVCQRGWRGRYCGRDLNECAKRNHLCSHRCKNTAGSYRCLCRRGFELMSDGHTCSRPQRHHRPARLNNATSTPPNATSHRGRPRPRPRPVGIRGVPDRRRPTGASLCARAKCQHKCVMTSATTATCTCPGGFRLARNRRKCIDINECKLGSHTCKNRNWCHNTLGSYKCQCSKGFLLINDTDEDSTCEDINECLTGQHMCGVHSTCHNTVGSYRCRCNRGYQGDGFSCEPSSSDQLPSAVSRHDKNKPAGLVATSLPNVSRRPEQKKNKAKRPGFGKEYQLTQRAQRNRITAMRRRYPHIWRRIMAFRRRQRLLSG